MVSYSPAITDSHCQWYVLILVVVDDGLVPMVNKPIKVEIKAVLILVVVDDGLVLDLIRHY